MRSNSSISPLFVALVALVREKAGNAAPVMCSKIRDVLVRRDPSVYERAGVKRFKQYINLAVSAGVLIAGGKGARRWISLLPADRDANVLASASIGSNLSSLSPTLSSPNISVIADDQSDPPIEAVVESGQTYSAESALQRLRSWPTALPTAGEKPLDNRHPIPLPSEFAILVRVIREHHGDEVNVLYKMIRHAFYMWMPLLLQGRV